MQLLVGWCRQQDCALGEGQLQLPAFCLCSGELSSPTRVIAIN